MSATLKNAIRAVNRTALMLGSISTLAISSAAFAQEEGALMEEIEVTGIRGSLKAAMDVKRFSNSVVDAISSEDIGKFPDKNVAESLARLPGVAISRDFGEGAGVTIRGLAPQFNLTTVNGQAVGTSQWFVLADATRNFNFELLSSEMIGGAEVMKSAQADVDEGGLGGTVNLLTRKPLDMDANTIFASIEGQYGDLAEEWDPSVSGLYSWKNDAETFGALIAVSHQQRTTQREATEMFPAYFSPFDRDWLASENPQTPFNAPAGSEGQGIIPWGIGSALFEQDRERNGLDVNLQFAPTDQLEFGAHYFFSEMQADNSNSNFIGLPFRGLFAAQNVSPGTVSGGIVESLQVSGGDPAPWANHVAYDNIYRKGSSMETEIIDLNGTFEGEGFTISGQLGTTTGEGTAKDFFTEFYANSQDTRVNFDFTNPGGKSPAISYERSPWIADPTSTEMTLNNVFDQVNETEDTEDYAQIDLSLEVDFGVINELKFGGKIRDRSFEQVRMADKYTNGVNDGVTRNLGWASEYKDGTQTVDHDETSMGSLTTFKPNEGAMRSMFAALPVCTDPVTVSECRSGTLKDNSASYKVEEDISAIYAMANFEGEGFRGNVGVRYVQTDTTSSGFDLGSQQAVSADGSYDNVLPSINVAYDLTDDLLLRAAAGKSISRPSPFALSYAVNLTPETLSGNAGNPNLKPTQANQYDLGMEWYYSDASMASISYFNKDISDFTYETTQAAVIGGVQYNALTTFANGGTANLEGVELSVQHSFDSGFGVQASYTKTNLGEGDVVELNSAGNLETRGIVFPGTSDDLLNVSGFYENDMFSARLNYSYRSEFFIATNESSTRWGDEQEQWDAQVTFNVTDNITLRAEALNLTGETIDQLHKSFDGTEAKGTQLYNGRRFFVGANFNF
jgi:iron complex outermembrane receptor protein